jgi:hypothetical protein
MSASTRAARIREPLRISETEAAGQLALARRAVVAGWLLLDPCNVVRLPYLSAEGVEVARAAVGALSEAGCARTPVAAADVIVNMVSKLRSA